MVAMLDACQAADGSAEREQWYLDNWGAVCAEIGAALLDEDEVWAYGKSKVFVGCARV